MTTWEAFNGIGAIAVGTKPNGDAKVVLVTHVIVCTSERDAKLVTKTHPSRKFVRRESKAAKP